MKQQRQNRQEDKFVWLVYCNKDPVVYSIEENKQSAVRYAIKLIRWRREWAIERDFKFGFYHFNPFVCSHALRNSKKEDSHERFEMTVFTACIKCRDDKSENGLDGCFVKVIRRMISPPYKGKK